MDREKVISEIVERIESTLAVDSEFVNVPLDLLQYALAMMKEQERLLRRTRKNRDKLSEEYSNLKHRFHEKTEIVRCKDCQHFDGIDCKANDIVNIMNTNWYCADGERKE